MSRGRRRAHPLAAKARRLGIRFPQPFYWTSDQIEALKEREQLRGVSPYFLEPSEARSEILATGRVDFVVEGDSWFNHPLLEDVVDCLKRDGYTIAGSYLPGEYLREMVERKRYLEPLKDFSGRAVLLSGGGNDLIDWRRTAEGVSAVFRNGAPSTSPKDYVVMSEIDAAMNETARLLGIFVSDVRGVQKNVRIATHFYDVIEPRWHWGWSWIHPQLETLGVPRNQPLRNGIAALLIEAANKHYAATCADLGITFASMLGIVKGRWFDEIHPKNAAFREIATRLANAAVRATRSRNRSRPRKPRRQSP